MKLVRMEPARRDPARALLVLRPRALVVASGMASGASRASAGLSVPTRYCVVRLDVSTPRP